MYLNREPISLEEAQARLAALTITPRIVSKKIDEAHGFVLAENITAAFPIPAFRRSGYDGYGILAADDSNFPKDFEIIENIGAGKNFTGQLQPGQVVRIMTGAKVPDAVGKVIMLEQTEELDAHHVRILSSQKKSNIAEIGEEMTEGQEILPVGLQLNAGAISLLYAFGISEVSVYDKPRVAVVATGSELQISADDLQNGKIFNSNGPLLAALTTENNAILSCQTVIKDDLEETRRLIKKLVAENDFVITTGGVSVGDFDYMAVIAKESGNLLFNKLSMRPGSPTTAFVLDDIPVIALSGNPSACFTGFWFFVEPLIKRFQNLETAVVPYQAILPTGYNKKNEFDRYLHGFMDEESEVTLNGSGQSSELGSIWQANCFFEVPHDTTIPANSEVNVWLIP